MKTSLGSILDSVVSDDVIRFYINTHSPQDIANMAGTMGIPIERLAAIYGLSPQKVIDNARAVGVTDDSLKQIPNAPQYMGIASGSMMPWLLGGTAALILLRKVF